MRAFDTGYRFSSLTCNDPIIMALSAYERILERLREDPQEGIEKLYAVQSGGVDLGANREVITGVDTPFLVESSPVLWRDDHIKGRLKAYSNYLLKSNLCGYIDLLSQQIRARLETLPSAFPTEAPEYMPLDWAERKDFPPSPMLCGHLNNIVNRLTMPVNNQGLAAKDLSIALESTYTSVFSELDKIVKNGGRGEVYPYNITTLNRFLDVLPSIYKSDWVIGSDWRIFAFPLFRIVLGLVRLIYGQVKPTSLDRAHVEVDRLVEGLKITDLTLVSIPAPTIATCVRFSDGDGSSISTDGSLYLTYLEQAYRCGN